MTLHTIAQVTAEMIRPIAELGWPGVFLWVVATRLDRMEHTMKGLSMALWMDLAARPSSEEFIKAEARKRIAKMEAKDR